jgi:hypothetical protein
MQVRAAWCHLGKNLKGAKDSCLSFGAQKFINYKLSKVGKVLKLKLDSDTKTIEIEIMLDGEKEPLSVRVERYWTIEEDGHHYLMADGISTSRRWIDTVAEHFVSGKRFEIAPEYVKMLSLVV